MKINRLILLLIAFAITTGATAQTLDEIKVKMNEAGEKYNAKDFTGAIPLFKQTLEMISTALNDNTEQLEKDATKFMGDSYRRNGMALAKEKKYRDAISVLVEARKIFLNTDVVSLRNVENLISACYNRLAAEKIDKKEYDAAAAICMEGVKQNKRDIKLMILAAQCKEKAGKDNEAIAIYEEAMALGKSLSRLKADGIRASEMLVNGQLVRAKTYLDKGNTKAALERVDVALKYAPKNPKAELFKIQIYFKSKNYSSVVKLAPAIIEIQRTLADKSALYFYIGASYVGLNNESAAITNYKKVTGGPNVPEAKRQIIQLTKNIEAKKKNAENA